MWNNVFSMSWFKTNVCEINVLFHFHENFQLPGLIGDSRGNVCIQCEKMCSVCNLCILHQSNNLKLI